MDIGNEVRLVVALLTLMGNSLLAHADASLGSVSSIQVDVLSKSTTMWNGQPLPPYHSNVSVFAVGFLPSAWAE